ncbi:MAG TPA: hypothetical protein VGL42_11930 [Opitutaceae bacterium]|jgi:hypothetical protein
MKLLLLAAAAATQWWAQGNPAPDEQVAMEWLNRARSDPPATLSQMISAAPTDPVLAGFFAALAPETNDQLLADLQAACALAIANSSAYPRSAAVDTAPLAFYPLFQAQAHTLGAPASWPPPTYPPGRTPPAFYPAVPLQSVLFSGASAVFSGPNASGGTAQFGPFGANFWEETQADLYSSAIGPREFVLSWLSDPGSGSPPPGFWVQGDSLPDLTLGHTRLAGIDLTGASGSGIRTLTLVRGSMEFLTQSDLPYGPLGTAFVTGVAYRDQNGNGRYDSGEGSAGVTITLDHGGWGAVTADAGGYAIPVPVGSGSYAATASWADGTIQTAQITVGADNVKVDWVRAPAPGVLPPQISIPAPAPGAKLVNVSTRGLVEGGQNSLIAGFYLSGAPGMTKTLLIRGVGPTLQNFGLPESECIPLTQLQVFAGAALQASNTGWTTAADGGAAVAAAAAQCGAFPLVRWAGGGGDSALVVTLAPGLYSAVVSPPSGTPSADATGHLGLVEVYDLSPGSGCQIVNLSSRGFAGTGDQALIIGASIAGSGTERVLLRAAGPALSPFGIGAPLSNPFLTLYDQAASPIATDDDWGFSAQTDQIASLGAAVGAFPFAPGSADSALIAALPPGTFTAAIAGSSGTPDQGIALVEIYAAP